jgi:HAE1 family hydrophobic/amphiphilic exporter-1
MNLASRAVRRPVSVAMLFLGLALMGLFAGLRLPLEQFPEMDIPFVGVSITYPNATPEEVEENLARPIEEVLLLLEGIDEIRSNSSQNHLWISLMLDSSDEIAGKGNEAKELIDNVRHRLPESVRYIDLYQRDPNDSPILSMMITAPMLDEQGAYTLLDQGLKMRLERLNGVNSVEVFGIQQNYLEIALDPARLESLGVQVVDVRRRLQSENFVLSGGEVDGELQTVRVRPMGQFASLEDIEQLRFANGTIRLKDFAAVRYVPEDWTDRRRVNGEASLGLSVFKKPEANLVEVARLVEGEISRVRQEKGYADMVFTPMDSAADVVITALSDLAESGTLGAVLSLATLFLFLRSFRRSLLIAATVPLSLCVTLGVMFFSDMSLNILSLVGLMLAIGLLVDNSVVASEAIDYRRKRESDGFTAAALGISDIGLAIAAGTLTTVIVFVPSFMTDIQQVAVIQQNLAIPLVVSLLASLVIAQTLVPTIVARLPQPSGPDGSDRWDRFGQWFDRITRWAITHKMWVLLLSVSAFASSLWIYQKLDVNMNPDAESPRLELRYYVRGSMDIEYIEGYIDQTEAYLMSRADELEIESLFSSYNLDRGRTTIVLSDDSERSPKVVERMIQKGLPQVPEIRARFGGRYRGMGGGGNPLSVRLIGRSTDVLIEKSDALIEILDQVPGLVNVRSNAESSREEVLIRVLPERVAGFGLTAQDVGQAVSAAFGTQMTRGFVSGEREFDLWLGLDGRQDFGLNALQNLPIATVEGQTILLKMVATLERQSSLRVIRRENRETQLQVEFDLDGITPEEAKAVVESTMASFALPAGYRWSIGKGFEQDMETFQEMVVNTLFAILLIYMLLAALFESLLHPVSIVMAIAFSVVGVFWTLWAWQTPLTSMTLTGMLLLAGIVVNNGIVLLSRIIQLRREGLDRSQAISLSVQHRLRPILMTTCTTIAGMLPLALGEARVGGLGPSYAPMARAIIGGLTVATVTTLVVLPVIYILLDDLKDKTRSVKHLLVSRLWRQTSI